ncbi:hypothetical protein QL285_050968 [Trifolium repens]|nr:hypothetical protein QL285_050968 [Trifolium repens]
MEKSLIDLISQFVMFKLLTKIERDIQELWMRFICPRYLHKQMFKGLLKKQDMSFDFLNLYDLITYSNFDFFFPCNVSLFVQVHKLGFDWAYENGLMIAFIPFTSKVYERIPHEQENGCSKCS